MPFQATVYNVMVASPSDVEESALEAIKEALARWNAMHSQNKAVVLLPRSWRTHSSPELGDRPQAILNKQLIGKSDLLIAVFWMRIGTATGEAESGTVEEIRLHRKQGKPVMIYFCEKPAPPKSFDSEQNEKLRAFRLEVDGLYDTYSTDEELREKVERHLNDKVHNDPYFTRSQTAATLLIKREASPEALSSTALQFLREAVNDSAAQLMRMKAMGAFFVATNQKTFHASTAKEEADLEAAITELEKAGFVRAEGYKRHAFKVTKAGFDYIDRMLKESSGADQQDIEGLVGLASTDPRSAIRKSWELVAGATIRRAGREPGDLSPDSSEFISALDTLRSSSRVSDRQIREIEILRQIVRPFFLQSDFAGAPPKEEAIKTILRCDAAARELLSPPPTPD